MFCAKCGKEIPQGYSFCPNCGAPAARNMMQNAQGNVQQAASNMQQTANRANPYIQQAAGSAQQPVNNANPFPQQNAGNYYGQQNYAPNSNYGQGPAAGGYVPQYGQNPQPNYQPNQQYNYGQQSFEVPPKKSKKGLLIGIIAAAAVAVAAILLFVWPGFLTGGGAAGSPEKTVQNFGAALQKMDFKTMIKCFDPESQKKMESTMDSLDDLNFGGFDISSLIDMMNLKVEMNVTNTEYNSDKTSCRAQVHMKMSYSFMGYSDSQEDDEWLNMVKQGGKWYIDGSNIDLHDLVDDIMGGIY